MLFDNQEEIQKLNVSPSALIEEMAKNLNRKSDIDCKFYETSHDVLDTRRNLMGTVLPALATGALSGLAST